MLLLDSAPLAWQAWTLGLLPLRLQRGLPKPSALLLCCCCSRCLAVGHFQCTTAVQGTSIRRLFMLHLKRKIKRRSASLFRTLPW